MSIVVNGLGAATAAAPGRTHAARYIPIMCIDRAILHAIHDMLEDSTFAGRLSPCVRGVALASGGGGQAVSATSPAAWRILLSGFPQHRFFQVPGYEEAGAVLQGFKL